MIFYNLIYRFLQSLMKVLSPVLDKKTKAYIQLRNSDKGLTLTPQQNRKRLWIHASSGEIEYAKSFIREYKSQYPEDQIYVSYSSLSAPNLFKNITNEVSAFFPLNWDVTSDNQRLINHLNPDILIFSRTDFWPNLIRQAEKNKIKLAAIATNPNFSLASSFWLRFCCKNFDYISCVEENQVDRLKNILPHTKIEYIPDTRFDQVFHRLGQTTLIELNKHQKRITLGSTWPKDEQVIKPVVKNLLEKGYSIVWAPHDVKNADPLLDELKKQFDHRRVLKLGDLKGSETFDILVVDRIGVLADFYRYSELSFVGGSFVSRVHSVMEPLCAGNFVIVGPHYANNPEAKAFKKLNLVKSVTSSEEFLEAVNYFEQNQEKLKELKQRTESKKGGSAKTVQAIVETLKS